MTEPTDQDTDLADLSALGFDDLPADQDDAREGRLMIEPTDEMVAAFMRAAAETPVQVAGRELLNARAGLAAALAIVERDYEVLRKPGSPADHEFQPHDDPRFGAAFGGGCGAMVASRKFGTVVCGWQRAAHRRTS